MMAPTKRTSSPDEKIIGNLFQCGEVDENCASGSGTELDMSEVRRVPDSEKAKNAVDGKLKSGASASDKFDVCHGTLEAPYNRVS